MNIPPPPDGFVVQGQGGTAPPPPPGFQLEQQQPAPAQQPTENWAPPGVLAPIQYNLGPDGRPVGARLAVPQILTDAWNAMQAPGRAMQGQYDQVEIGPDGSVTPFDPRMVEDASSLASLISPTSAASRIGLGAGAAIPRKIATPDIADLYTAKNAAYDAVDKLGARYSADAIDSLYMDMYRRVGQENIDPSPDGAHKAAVRMLERLNERQGPMTLARLDQLRQVIRRDVIDGGSKADGHMGQQMISAIDDFIENATPNQISGVTGDTANWAIQTARKANQTLRKSETLQEALDKARLNAAASGSGGNIDNAIRQQIKSIITNPNKARGFTKAELATMEKIVMRDGPFQNMMRRLGKLSPSGNGLMAALGLGATAANPLLAIGPAAGLVAKTISDNATQKAAEALTRDVRMGGAPPIPRLPNPITPRANTTLIEQQVNKPLPPLPAMQQLPSGVLRLNT